VITNYNTGYTWGGSVAGGAVSFSGTTGNGLATITGIAPNTAAVATITLDRSGYATGSAASTSTTSLQAALTPAFGTYTRTAGGFSVVITNYDTNYNWAGSVLGGAVSFSGTTGNGLATITGIGANTASVATITTTRSGYATGSAASTSTTSLSSSLTPTFGTYTRTADGFTVVITNYDATYNWAGSVSGGSVAITGSGSTGLATITGIAPNTAAVATITTTRSGYIQGSANSASTTSLLAARTPTFGTYTPTADGFTVVITNYDSAYSWTASATNGGSVAFSGVTGNGLATITGVGANTSSVATINTALTNYAPGSAQATYTSLRAALIPTFGTYTPTTAGFTVVITNYDPAFDWTGSATRTSNSVSFSGVLNNGLATITGVSANTASVATITTTRSGYASGSAASTSTTSLLAGIAPTFGTYTPTADGFTVVITNYNTGYTWGGSVAGGAVSFSGTTGNGLATITGIAPNTAAVATITLDRSGYATGSSITSTITTLKLALARPLAPTVVTTINTKKSLDVSWISIPHATSYTLRLYSAAEILLNTVTSLSGTSKTLTVSDYASFADRTSYKVSITAIGDTQYADSDQSPLSSAVATNLGTATSPTIVTSPTNITVQALQMANFTVEASNSDDGTLSEQWQISVNGGTSWTNVTTGSGGSSTSYTTAILAITDTGARYRVIVTNTIGETSATATSSVAILTVTKADQASLTLTSIAGILGQPLTLVTSGGSSNGALSYTVSNGSATGCSIRTAILISSIVGTCRVTVVMAGNTTYNSVSTGAVTVTLAASQSSIALTLSSSVAYQANVSIVVGVGTSGIVTFKQNGRVIPSCGAIKASVSNPAVCTWKPSTLGSTQVQATLVPTNTGYIAVNSLVVNTIVTPR
jgi:hypothetical protein